MKEIPLGNGQNAKVDDEDLQDDSLNRAANHEPRAMAHDTPSGRRVFMHDVIMGLDTLEDQ